MYDLEETTTIDLTRIEAEARRMRAEAFRDLIVSARRGIVGLFTGHGATAGKTA